MKLATTTGDLDNFSDRYLERIKCVFEAGVKNIDLSLYTLKENKFYELTLYLKKESARLLYKIGRHILDEYNCFEE